MTKVPIDSSLAFWPFLLSCLQMVACFVLRISCFAMLLSAATAQMPVPDGRDGRPLLLENFRPRPMLKVPEHPLTQAKFPVIDIHTHFRHKFRGGAQELADWVELMDRNHIALCVSLDGQWGSLFDEHQRLLYEKYQDRFAIFANIDWQGDGRASEPASWAVNRPDFARRTARELAQLKARGAAGVKIFKGFGLEYKNADGSLIAIDDERFDPIWEACGELRLPVLIHVADPAAFFLPIDETNERWEELHRRPDWSFYGPQFPPRDELLAAFLRVVKKHPQTIFIAAHVASSATDLAATARWLDDHPNLYVEIASRTAELGRQPFTARRFLIKYQDRVLFGTDGPWPEERVCLYWRFLETEDEYFPYSERPFPPQGLWNIYGVNLPDEVLRKLYHQNALKLLPALAETLNRATQARGASKGH